MAAIHRSTETEIATAVARYLSTLPSGEASIYRIRKNVPAFAGLTAADQEPSDTRQGEQMWEQQVRNIVSHRLGNGNFVQRGILAWRPRHLALTDAGRQWLAQRT